MKNAFKIAAPFLLLAAVACGKVEPVDETHEGTLEEGDKLHDADNSFYDSYNVKLKEGMTLSVTMTAADAGFDTYLQVFSPTDKSSPVIENDDCGEASYELPNPLDSCIHEYTALESGLYLIFANAYDEGMTGAYTLKIKSAE